MRYVSFSGGVDSTALAIYLKDKGEEIELVFSDTACELPETYWIIPRVARALGVKLHVVSNGSMFEHLVRRGFFLPGPRVRWCTKELKQTPMRLWAKGRDGIISVGIRADESHRLEKTGSFVTGLPFDRPLVDAGYDKKTVLELCEKHDLVNPCYRWRSSCSCFCCPFQRKQDWLNLSREHPDLYRLAEEWEHQSGLESHHTKFTWSGRWSLRELRDADEAQVRLLPEQREEACAICQW